MSALFPHTTAYVTGQTDSPDFPVTTLSPVGVTDPGTLVHGVCNPLTGLLAQPLTQTVSTAITTTGGLCYDAFVTRLSSDGQALLYSTYLGGGRDDYGYGIAADANGAAYVTGRTESPDFPVSGTVGGRLDTTSGGPLGGGIRRATRRRARTPSRSSSTPRRAAWCRWACPPRTPPRSGCSAVRAAAAVVGGYSATWSRARPGCSRCPCRGRWARRRARS